MSKATLHKAFLVGTGALLAGCAVLTVDVDVYKGPLANHEDIQMEQMAAMAIGAKPLLIELRDRLEAKYMKLVAKYPKDFKAEDNWTDEQIEYYKNWGDKDLETRLAKLRELSWYKPEFVAPEFVSSVDPNCHSYFRDFNADTVNNILYLYKDRYEYQRDERYSLFMSRIWQALRDYKIAYNVLRPESNKEDVRHWKKFELKPNSFDDEAKNLLPDKPSPEDIKKLRKRSRGIV